jgi:hypothetical protein
MRRSNADRHQLPVQSVADSMNCAGSSRSEEIEYPVTTIRFDADTSIPET